MLGPSYQPKNQENFSLKGLGNAFTMVTSIYNYDKF